MYLLSRMSEVPSAVNSAAKTVGVHVCASAEPIHEEYDIGVSPRCDRKGPEVIDANRDTRAGRQGEREDGPRHRLSGRLSRRFPFLLPIERKAKSVEPSAPRVMFKGSTDLGVDCCYAGVPLAPLR